jgi:hypothetical protein
MGERLQRLAQVSVRLRQSLYMGAKVSEEPPDVRYASWNGRPGAQDEGDSRAHCLSK